MVALSLSLSLCVVRRYRQTTGLAVCGQLELSGQSQSSGPRPRHYVVFHSSPVPAGQAQLIFTPVLVWSSTRAVGSPALSPHTSHRTVGINQQQGRVATGQCSRLVLSRLEGWKVVEVRRDFSLYLFRYGACQPASQSQ